MSNYFLDIYQFVCYTPIMQLRDYQIDIISKARGLMKQGNKSILIQSPTGSGKTILVAHMLKTAASKGMDSWFIVHRRELVKQSIMAFSGEGVKHGVIANGWAMNNKLPIQIASIQTLIRRYKYYRKPSLLVYDECHHVSAGSWKKIIDQYPGAYSIGLTATPQRLDGQGLGLHFKEMINGPSVQKLTEDGYLCPYKLYAPSNIDTSRLHTRMGDFVQSEVSGLVDRPMITGDAIKHYQKLCYGKRAIVFCASIKHSEHVVKQFNDAGISAAHVDGETDMNERDRMMRLFRDGTIKVLSNVDLFGEGVDVPTLEAVILLRPTMSLGLYLQQVGRVLRPSTGKEFAYILDHVGNAQRHGLPDDEREWSLAGSRNNRRSDGESVHIKTCPKCYAVQRIGQLSCNFCGFVYEIKHREIDHVEGELVEVDYQKLRREKLKAQGMCHTREQLIAEGQRRGYKRPRLWAEYVLKARGNKK
jgi:superfamily II DNA or RNA helicase